MEINVVEMVCGTLERLQKLSETGRNDNETLISFLEIDQTLSSHLFQLRFKTVSSAFQEETNASTLIKKIR